MPKILILFFTSTEKITKYKQTVNACRNFKFGKIGQHLAEIWQMLITFGICCKIFIKRLVNVSIILRKF